MEGQQLGDQGSIEEGPKKVKKYRVIKTVLPAHMGGGPQNLGDPESKELRIVEEDICIPEMMREKAKMLCDNYGEEYAICARGRTVTMATNCRKEAHIFGACLKKWLDNEKFRQMCTEEYLEQRSEYRLTGKRRKWEMINSGMHGGPTE